MSFVIPHPGSIYPFLCKIIKLVPYRKCSVVIYNRTFTVLLQLVTVVTFGKDIRLSERGLEKI
jgi:hypothetical protein